MMISSLKSFYHMKLVMKSPKCFQDVPYIGMVAARLRLPHYWNIVKNQRHFFKTKL